MPTSVQPGKVIRGKDRDINTPDSPVNQRDNLARPASLQPGKVIKGKDSDINTPDSPEISVNQREDLAIPASLQPGKVIRGNDKDINTPDSPAMSVNQRDKLAMSAYNQPGKVIRWKDRDINKLDNTAIPANPQSVRVDEFKEQVETGHSRDSLAMPPTSQPVTVNRVDQQLQEHIHKTCIGNATQTIQITNPRTPNSHHFLLRGRASTETSHIRNWQTTRLIPKYQQVRIIQPRETNRVYTQTRMLHPGINPISFYQGTPLFLRR